MAEGQGDWKEVSNTLSSRGSTVVCLSCGTDLPLPMPEYYLWRIDEANKVIVDRGLRTFARICLNCGYVHLHASNILTHEPPEIVTESNV
ncbi:MAG TPA: hypothetical protein VIJ70_09275 [Gaiellaceae bacterium]